jgi:hypothetical protein
MVPSSIGPVDTRYPTYMQRIQTKSITIYIIGVCSFLICEIACVCAVAIHSSQLVNLFIRTNILWHAYNFTRRYINVVVMAILD